MWGFVAVLVVGGFGPCLSVPTSSSLAKWINKYICTCHSGPKLTEYSLSLGETPTSLPVAEIWYRDKHTRIKYFCPMGRKRATRETTSNYSTVLKYICLFKAIHGSSSLRKCSSYLVWNCCIWRSLCRRCMIAWFSFPLILLFAGCLVSCCCTFTE